MGPARSPRKAGAGGRAQRGVIATIRPGVTPAAIYW